MATKKLPKGYYENIFVERIEKLEGIVIGTYINAKTPVECVCKNGHHCFPTPNSIQQGHGMCVKCVNHCPTESKKKFIINIKQLGGKVIGKYVNKKTPVECLCKNNHKCYPMPDNIHKGQGLCKKCANMCSITAKENFIRSINESGGRVLGKYQKTNIPVKCVCKKMHVCYPRPGDIQNGQGMCKKCVNHCPIEAEKNFINSINILGGKVLDKYINSSTKIKCVCKNKHICYPTPNGIQQGGGMCRKCAGTCPIEAMKNFYNNADFFKAIVLGDYVNSKTPIECLCKNGHKCYPTPSSIKQSLNICKICALNDNKSCGEKLVSDALEQLRVSYSKETKHPHLKRLRFDFEFRYNNINYYIEYDGEQHQNFNPYFHNSVKDFEQARERDLIKNYVIQNSKKCVLIRLDHTWCGSRKISEQKMIANYLAEYLQICLNDCDQKIIADGNMENFEIYNWVNIRPKIQTIKTYLL